MLISRHGIARAQRTIRSRARQRDKQGADAHENPGVGVSLDCASSLTHDRPSQLVTTRTIIVPQVVRRTFATGYAGA